MRIRCAVLSRQQATLALLVGGGSKRFTTAFVTVPRCVSNGLLTPTSTTSGGVTEVKARAMMTCSNRSNPWSSRRWPHDLQSPRHITNTAPGAMFARFPDLAGWTTAAATTSRTRQRPQSFGAVGSLKMSSSMTGATEGEEICRAAHILCAGEDEAEAALNCIKNGENFGEVAAQMSSCPSKEKGGDLGWFKKGQMVIEFEAACFGNDPGTIVKVQTQFGWHVVALLSRAVMPRQISVEELGEIVEQAKEGAGGADSKYQFVDVREEGELTQAKLDGFVNLPLSKFEEWGHKISGEDPILDKEKDIVIMCHHGMRSNQMAQHLATKEGFKKVWNVEGGIHAYAKQVNPAVGVY